MKWFIEFKGGQTSDVYNDIFTEEDADWFMKADHTVSACGEGRNTGKPWPDDN